MPKVNWSQDWVDQQLAKFEKKEESARKPAPDIRSIPEDELQAKVVKLAKQLGYKIYHTYDSRLSEEGWPDLVLVRKKTVIFAELKTETGKLTPSQKRWLAALMAAGQRTYCWRPSDIESIAKILQAAP